MSAVAGLTPARSFVAEAPDGLRIRAQEWGNRAGTDVLFIHGFCQCHLSWARQVSDPALVDALHMVTFDLRGHGATGGPEDRARYHADRIWADDVAAVIAAAGMERPWLVGWSHGGRVIADYLGVYGDGGIAGINYANAACSTLSRFYGDGSAHVALMLSDDMPTRLAATRAFLHACFAVEPDPDDFEAMLAFNMLVPPSIRRLVLDRPQLTADALEALSVPVLVTHGRADTIVLESMAEFIAATVRGARLSLYDGVGHTPFWEDAPRFNSELAAFVQ